MTQVKKKGSRLGREEGNKMSGGKNTLVWFLAGALIVLVGAILLSGFRKHIPLRQNTPEVMKQNPAIENDSDLEETSSDLDSANLDQFDSELKALDSDSSSF